jgi:high-affinity Fe2+/Pb2+ permease
LGGKRRTDLLLIDNVWQFCFIGFDYTMMMVMAMMVLFGTFESKDPDDNKANAKRRDREKIGLHSSKILKWLGF